MSEKGRKEWDRIFGKKEEKKNEDDEETKEAVERVEI